jgi:tetratricopeptide (TPR) repeat protein
MRPLALLFSLAAGSFAQQTSIGSISQAGTCTVAGVTGSVTINCPGLDPSIVRVLNEQFGARLKERDLRIEDLTKEVNEWKNKYVDLSARLADAAIAYGLTRQAEEFLKVGNLDEAGRVLDKVLASEEKGVDEIARNHFERGRLYELQFQPLSALPHYEKAYNYRPDNADYGYAYAALLYLEREYPEAKAVFEKVLQVRQDQAAANPTQYRRYVAATLNNLAVLHTKLESPDEATVEYKEAVEIWHELATSNPQQYLPDLATGLTNLASFYWLNLPHRPTLRT